MAGSQTLEGRHGKLAEKMLQAIASVLEKANIDYILDGGTLLGVVREKRLLPWDTDIDLSIRADQAEKFVRNRWKLWLKGYRTRVRYFKEDVGPFKKGDIRIIKIQTHFMFIKRHDVADVFVKHKFGDEYLNVVGNEPPIFWSFPVKFLEQYDTLELNNRTYMVPKDYTEYLTLLYGDWITPVKEWNYKTDMKCVRA